MLYFVQLRFACGVYRLSAADGQRREENVRGQMFDLFPRLSAWLRFTWATMFGATPMVHYPLIPVLPLGLKALDGWVSSYCMPRQIFSSPISPGFCQDVPCPSSPACHTNQSESKTVCSFPLFKTSSECLRGRRLPNQCLENTKVSLRSNQKSRKVRN